MSNCYKLSNVQQGLYESTRIVDNSVYQIVCKVSFDGNIPGSGLLEAAVRLVSENRLLRMAVRETEDGVVQEEANEAASLCEYREFDSEEEADRFAKMIQAEGTDINREMCRIYVYNTKTGTHGIIYKMSHLVTDGWSVMLMTDTFCKYLNGEEVRMYDYITEVVDQYDPERSARDILFWKEQYSGRESKYLNAHSLARHGSECVYRKIDADRAEKYKAFCADHRFGLPQMLFAAYGVLLDRIAEDRDADTYMEFTVLGRNGRKEKNTLGVFIKAFPILIETKEQSTLLECIEGTKETLLESYRHMNCTYGDVLEALREEDPQSRAFSDIGFNYLIQGANDDRYREIVWYPTLAQEKTLEIEVTEWSGEGSLEAAYHYDPSVIDEETVSFIHDRFMLILEQMISTPDAKLCDTEIYTEAEKAYVRKALTGEKVEYDRTETVSDLFRKQVGARGPQTAVVFGNETVSYTELNERADKLAAYIRNQGIVPDDFVCLIMDKSIDMIVSMLAVIKAGGAYIPIDPDYPDQRIRYILEDASPKMVIMGCNADISLPEELEVFNFNDAGDIRTLCESEGKDLQDVNSSSDLCYMIYTSGTTGNPKGVQIEHRNLHNLILSYKEIYSVTPDDVILQSAQYVFDQSVQDIFLPLLLGAKLVLITKEQLLHTNELAECVRRNRVTLMGMTPLAIAELNAEDFPGIRLLETGGGEANATVLRQWIRDGRQIFNTYGPTEYTVNTTSHLYTGEEGNNIPIGRAIFNTDLYILREGRVCGVNVPGELCISGDSMARGYLNRPEINEKLFTVNPFTGERMYRTGDLCRLNTQGEVEYLGRIDQQVKVRGFRIELAEIDNCIRQMEGIRDCVITATEEAVCAYVVSDEEIDSSRIKMFAAERLPYYMVPSFVCRIDSIPRTVNGKLDKKALPQFKESAERIYTAPSTPLEEALCGIFASVLELDKVGAEDNFFEIGGHSLRAVRLTNQIESILQYQIKVQDVFACPSVRQLAEFIEKNGNVGRSEEETIPKAEIKQYYPMSSAQKRMYLNWLMDKESVAYDIFVIYNISGELDDVRMENCLNEIVSRRSAFRTRFIMKEQDFLQEIVDECRIELERSDTSEGFFRPFDLNETPQLRARLVRNETEYQLLMDMPHIVSDGASVTLFMRELVELYNGGTLAPERLNYADYSEWMVGRDLSSQKKFWLDIYEDRPEPLNLPTDYSRPRVHTQRGSSVFRLIRKDAFRKFASSHRMTDYMLFLSGIMILMGKYAGTEDVVIGCPIHGRTTRDAEEIYGMFVNTVALRGYPQENKPLADFLQEISALCISAYDNQEYPFEELVEELKVERDLSRNPLFDVMFVLQNNEEAFDTPEDIVYMDGAVLNRSHEKRHGSKFDLSFAIMEQTDDFEVELEYCSDLFTEENAKRILEHLETVLEAMMSPDIARISDIAVVSTEEKEQILRTFAGASVDTDGNTIVSLFRKAAEAYPDRTAICSGDARVTYRELNDLVNIYANTMLEQGLTEGGTVAIVGERSIAMIAYCYAALKCGASYVMIDDLLPDERKEKIIRDSGAKLVFRAFASDELPRHGNTDEPVCEVTEDMPAYIIYTSGTTGEPKGVVCRHRGVTNLILWLMKEHPFAADGKILEKTNLSFVDSVYEMFWPLSAGAMIEVLPQGDEMYLDRLLATVRENAVTNLILVPTVLNELLMLAEGTDLLDSVRMIMLSGEPLKAATVQKARTVLNPQCVLINQYGQTEGGFSSTYYEIRCNELSEELPAGDYQIMPIGRSIQNVSHYIMQGKNLCGIGIPGEICIHSKGLFRGYIADQGMTDRKLTPNPFGEGVLCHTGDYGKYLSDGTMVCLGRMDNQIKIRGQRIELGEIENVIRNSGLVRACAVTALRLNENSPDKSIVVYLVLNDGQQVEAVEKVAAEKLPMYMVPTAFVQMDAIPYTRNGKLDKRALPMPEKIKEAEYIMPRTGTEIAVCEMFESILGLEKTGIKDDFFLCGGHSLKAAYLCNQIVETFSVNVAVKDIFTHSTPEALAQFIDSLPKTENVIEPIPKAEKKEAYPLTPVQKQFYIASMSDPDTLAFNMSFEIKLEGDVDVDRLKSSFAGLVETHSALRLSFELRNGEPCQILHDDISYEMEIAEDGLPDFHKPFDLTKAPLIRAGYVRKTSVLMFDLHHIICDGASLNMLLKDLTDLYNGKSLPAEKVSFIDYTEWMNHKDLSRQKSFWNGMFADEVPVLNIPTDRMRTSIRSNNGNTIRGELDQESIHEFVAREGISEYMLLLAASMITLGKFGNTEDLVIGSPISGRVHRDIENLPGIFINNMALRGRPASDKKISDFLSEIKSMCLEAFENQEYPFVSLVEDLHIVKDASRSPLFDVMLIVQNNNMENEEETPSGGLRFGKPESQRNGSKYDMIFEIVDEDGYKINYEYNTDLYDDETAEKMLGLFELIVDEIVKGTCEKIGELSDGLPQDVSGLISQYGRRELPKEAEGTIISVFNDCVRRLPDKTACIEGDDRLTYKELSDLAHELADTLMTLGVRKGDVVPIIGGRSMDYVISIYGILMTGAAFASVEASLPRERRDLILEEVHAKWYIKDRMVYRVSGERITQEDLNGCQDRPKELPEIRPEDTAYIHFTSGTDGRPKGAKIPHRGTVLRNLREKGLLSEDDVFFFKTNISYVVAIVEVFYGTLFGGTMVILKQGYESNVKEIIKYVRKYRITDMVVVPTILNLMIEELLSEGENCDRLPSLRRIECGGEPLAPFIAGKALKMFGDHAAVLNHFGQTETSSIMVSHHQLTADDVARNRVPLGTPFEFNTLYLVKDGNICGIGVPGEICVGGAGISNGYLDEKLNSDKYGLIRLPDTGEEVTVYHSGDLARWDHTGILIGMGRRDHQVKIHGQRLELGDVNNAIKSLDQISDGIVVARKNKQDELQLCAYVVCEPDRFDVQAIRLQLSEKLPRYMVPASITRIDKIPVTINGKVDQRNLPEPEFTRDNSYVEPSNPTEELLCNAFAHVLELERVGAEDSFFEIGGDSISSISLCMVLEKEELLRNGRTLTPSDVLVLQTPKQIAAFLNKYEDVCFQKDIDFTRTDKAQKDIFRKILKERKRKSAERTELKPNIINRFFLARKGNSVGVKLAFTRKGELEDRIALISKAFQDTVFEYAYDGKRECYIRNNGIRSEISCFDITEAQGDVIARDLVKETFDYDGKHILSDVFLTSSPEEEYDYLYYNIQHSLTDRMATVALKDKLNRIYYGQEEVIPEFVPEPETDKVYATYAQYKELAEQMQRMLKKLDYQRVAVEKPMTEAEKADPIPEILDLYLQKNPVLDKMEQIPILLISSGRNIYNRNEIGCCLKILLQIYDRRNRTFTDVEEFNEEDLLRNDYDCIPLINYIGTFEDVRSKEKIMRIAPGFERAKYLHGSLYEDSLILKLPIYRS